MSRAFVTPAVEGAVEAGPETAKLDGKATTTDPDESAARMNAELPEMVSIPAGDFLMGSEDGDEDERPVHRVQLDAYSIGVQPVTQAEYARFVQAAGYRAPGLHELPLVVTAGSSEREQLFFRIAASYVWANGEPPRERHDHPVTLVRWEDAAAYCAWLSAETGRAIRLPTEAEWEKAARGGLRGQRYPWGDRFDSSRLNFLEDAAQKPERGTTPCRLFPPNGLGLFDTAGNVWEWVHDWYSPETYSAATRSNPTGPDGGRLRIVRGGAWLVADVRMLRCSHRHKVPSDTYSYSIGFRIASSG